MKPASWLGTVVGVCCICCFVLLTSGILVIFYLILSNAYTSLNRLSILLIASFASGSLLFGTAGMTLLTSRYREHKRVFQLVWLILGILAIILLLAFWIDSSVVR